MNTIVTLSNPSLPQLASIPPGQANTTASSLVLFGKNYANFGTYLNDDLVHLMEHFASPSPPANPITGQLWYDSTTKTMMVWDSNIGIWSLLNANSYQNFGQVTNRVYVSKNGNDSNSGLTVDQSKLTISSAIISALQQQSLGNFDPSKTAIIIASGEYVETCPITIPKGISLIGDSSGTVTVIPSVPTSNVFLLNSGCYVYGITVRGHQLSPSAFDITPVNYVGASGANLPISTSQTGWAFSFAPGAKIDVSPYIQNCSSVSGDTSGYNGAYPGGGGVLCDPSQNDPSSVVNSIMVDTFTQTNLGGIGAKIANNGYMQIVNFVTNFCQFSILTCNGGNANLINSVYNYGNYALWSDGQRKLTNPTAINQSWTGNGSNVTFTTNAGTQLFTSQVNDFSVYVNGVLKKMYIDYTVTTNVSPATITFATPPTSGSVINAYIIFPSLIESNGCSFNYVGAGTTYNNTLYPNDLPPSQGGIGQGNSNNYTITTNNGRIYNTGMDENGNFYVGPVTPGKLDSSGNQLPGNPTFRINQQTGVIDGQAFYQSVFGFMTPFVLALTRKY